MRMSGSGSGIGMRTWACWKPAPIMASAIAAPGMLNAAAAATIAITNLAQVYDGQPKAGTTIWSVGSADGDMYAPSKSSFMINYRVADLQALLQALRSEGCNVLEKTDDSEYGKFGWVMDPEGNKVELWQPPAGQ